MSIPTSKAKLALRTAVIAAALFTLAHACTTRAQAQAQPKVFGVYDAGGNFVGTYLGDFDNVYSFVLRRSYAGGPLLRLNFLRDTGLVTNAMFFYTTQDCSGPAYLPDYHLGATAAAYDGQTVWFPSSPQVITAHSYFATWAQYCYAYTWNVYAGVATAVSFFPHTPPFTVKSGG